MSGWISSKLKVAETLLQQIDQQAAESLRKNEKQRSDEVNDEHLSRTTEILPLKDQLKKKTIENDELVGKSGSDQSLNAINKNHTFEGDKRAVASSNPKPSLTDSDWTELLSAPNKPTRPPGNTSNGIRGLRKGSKTSASNLLRLDGKKDQKHQNTAVKSLRNSKVGTESKVNGVPVDGKRSSDGESSRFSDSVPSTSSSELGNDVENLEIREVEGKNAIGNITVKHKIEVDKAKTKDSENAKRVSSSSSDEGSDSDSDSSSTSDSEIERRREERRKRREQILAEKAAAKAIEAIKERENLVARLEGEKQSLEKILEERAKQQAEEASKLQTTMMETMDAVDLEKQKHNNTRMEALLRMTKLETANADLARSLASAQWTLEQEINRVTELRQDIEFKQGRHEELRRRISSSRDTSDKFVASKGAGPQSGILEAEFMFIADKVARLQEKAKTMEASIEMTKNETENPTEVEVELKRRLSQLTDHLIQKQAQVESLSSEKAMLLFRIESVTRLVDENKSSNSDLETGVWGELSSSNLRPAFEDKLRSGKKHFGSLVRQLDSIFSAGAVVLRRNSTARIWAVVYLVCLHLWVLYILKSHSPVSVVSLENLNNTGV